MSSVFLKFFLYFLNFFLYFIKFFLDIINILLYNYDKKGGERMGYAKMIRMALGYKNMSESELARQIGTTPQAFSQRMKTDKFKYEELEKIGNAIGCKFVARFEFPDKTRI